MGLKLKVKQPIDGKNKTPRVAKTTEVVDSNARIHKTNRKPAPKLRISAGGSGSEGMGGAGLRAGRDGSDSNGAGKAKAPRLSLNLKNAGDPSVRKIRVKSVRQPGDGYDSEAPDREEDPMIEEGLILRMLPGDHLDYLRAAADNNDLSSVNLKFVDARRAVLTIHGQMFAAKLVDLPTLIEAQKTFDRKNIYKTADICQMLLVTEPIEQESDVFEVESTKQLEVSSRHSSSVTTMYPHGMAPPLYNVRKKRFRPRVSMRAIEEVETKVDKLFADDMNALETKYELFTPQELERAPPAQSSTLNSLKAPTTTITIKTSKSKAADGSTITTTTTTTKKDAADGTAQGEETTTTTTTESKDNASTRAPQGTAYSILDNMEVEGDGEDGNDGDLDDELGAELELALQNDSEQDDDDDDDDDDEDNEGDVDEDTVEARQHNRLLREEIRELETTLVSKENDLKNTTNAILKNRFNGVVVKLRQELENKKRQLRETEAAEANGEAETPVVVDNEAEDDDDKDDGEDDEIDELF